MSIEFFEVDEYINLDNLFHRDQLFRDLESTVLFSEQDDSIETSEWEDE